MPKEKKKRGRREEKKRKREEADATEYPEPVKRHRSDDAWDESFDRRGGGQEYEEQESYAPHGQYGHKELPFYGLLDEQEQAYFRQADTTLDLNHFEDAEAKDLFLNNLWREAKGKELKIANSQSCSRLMERLIAASTPVQLKSLWMKFNTHFLNLFQHRFASHCCEALFRKAAKIAAVEMREPAKDVVAEEGPDGQELLSMESLFLGCVGELEGNIGYLMTDQFASHPLRILLVVLSGMPLESTSTTALLQSKKKEHNIAAGQEDILAEAVSKTSTRIDVPDSFHDAVQTIISGATANLDTSGLRALATHPIANPVIQLLLTISLSRSGKQTSMKDPRSIFRLLIPDDPPEEGTESAAFINHLLYDPVGSRLLEVIVAHAPGKTFKTLYKSLFKPRIGSMARNETASFVVMKILERLGAADLESVLALLCEEIGTLVQRSRTAVIKTLIERCHVRGVSTAPLADALRTAYGTTTSPAEVLRKMLNMSEDAPTSSFTNDDNISADRKRLLETTDGNMSADRRRLLDNTDANRLNGSLLAQAMLSAPGPLHDLITDAILDTEMPTLLAIAEDRISSRILQAALQPTTASTTTPPIIKNEDKNNNDNDNRKTDHEHHTQNDLKFKRQFLPTLYPYILQLATHPVASHLIDACWHATTTTTTTTTSSSSLRHIRETLAAQLLHHEPALRASVPGRAVWRNWKMDLFKARRREWLDLDREVGSGSGLGRGLSQGKGMVVGVVNGGKRRGVENGLVKGKKGKMEMEKEKERGIEMERAKTGIEMARERFALNKLKKGRQQQRLSKGNGWRSGGGKG